MFAAHLALDPVDQGLDKLFVAVGVARRQHEAQTLVRERGYAADELLPRGRVEGELVEVLDEGEKISNN